MTLIELKAEHLKARKARNPYAKVIGTMIADLEMDERRGKPVNSNVITSKVWKYIDTANDNITAGGDEDILSGEVSFLENLLPPMLNDAQIMTVFKCNHPTNIGAAMKLLQDNHAGCFSGKQASTLAKQYLGA